MSNPATASLLQAFITQHKLPQSFAHLATQHFLPLADWAYETLCQSPAKQAPVLGINGGQGTGKSTLAELVCVYLSARHNVNGVTISIDDLYLRKNERKDLAQTVHPLLQVRGVPGTHDVELGCRLIHDLKALQSGETMSIPRFDKSTDERHDECRWTQVRRDSGPDSIGRLVRRFWARSRSLSLRNPSTNWKPLRTPKAVWRQFVNENLRRVYPELFQLVDKLIFLAVPDFECVFRWRWEQEKKLALSEPSATNLMSKREVMTFVQHFERITIQNLTQLPEIADVVVALDRAHQVNDVRYRSLSG